MLSINIYLTILERMQLFFGIQILGIVLLRYVNFMPTYNTYRQLQESLNLNKFNENISRH